MIIAQAVSEHGEVVLRTGAAGYEIIVDGQGKPISAYIYVAHSN